MSAASGVERVVARMLAWGGLLSVSLMLGGLVVYALQGQPHVDNRVEPSPRCTR